MSDERILYGVRYSNRVGHVIMRWDADQECWMDIAEVYDRQEADTMLSLLMRAQIS